MDKSNNNDYKNWLKEFTNSKGRKPKVLHVGNIANNAYKNALMLNEYGIDVDVLCHDYYHCMACPEWEEVNCDIPKTDQMAPFWAKYKLNGYKRPSWFVQGSFSTCTKYLIARNSKKRRDYLYYKFLLAYENKTHKLSCYEDSIGKLISIYSSCYKKITPNSLYKYLYVKLISIHSRLISNSYYKYLYVKLKSIYSLCYKICKKRNVEVKEFDLEMKEFDFNNIADDLINTFNKEFPNREDKLVKQDMYQYLEIIKVCHVLFQQYDLIQAYATCPIYPLLSNITPYVAFEHGTLRTFTLENNSTCRLTSLAYNRADHVFITNGDCLEYAEKIKVKNYSAMLHPINEKKIREEEGIYIELHRKYDAKYLFLCPLRHDWEIKGVDVYIRALPKIKKLLGNTFKVIMTNWGEQVQDSINLAENLNVLDNIIFIEPLSRSNLIKYLKSVDIVFDQIALPHFGATAPEALAAEVPVIMSYEPSSTEWIIPEAAPILSAWNSDDIVKNISLAIDSDWLKKYKIQARDWYDSYHSSKIILQKHLEVYSLLIK